MVVKYTGDAKMEYAHKGDAALDLRCTKEFAVPGNATVKVETGIKLEIPDGYAGLVLPRSGLAADKGITVLNTPGLIDSGYRGEVCVLLHNTRQVMTSFDAGDRIAQLMFIKVPGVQMLRVDELSDSERGEGGFGSTGVK